MTDLFTSLQRGNGQNAASIPHFEILPCDYVAVWPGTRNGVMLGVIQPTEYKDWSRIYMTDQTAGYTEKMSMTAHGRKYAFQVSGFYPGDHEDLRRFLGISEWVKFMARVRDAHGLIRIVGTPKYGLEIDYESGIPAEMGGRRGTIFTFSAEMPVPSALEY